VLGPPKSEVAAGSSASLIDYPPLREHLSLFVGPEAEALIFPGVKGGPLGRSNFNKMAAWPHAVRAIGAEGLHFRDLRHRERLGGSWRREPEGFDGPDGPRQRTRRDHLPA
jgi:integrase